MTLLNIAVGLFLYFLFMWSFRIFFMIILIKVAGKIKENVEASVKEKVDSLKGSVKQNENM